MPSLLIFHRHLNNCHRKNYIRLNIHLAQAETDDPRIHFIRLYGRLQRRRFGVDDLRPHQRSAIEPRVSPLCGRDPVGMA